MVYISHSVYCMIYIYIPWYIVWYILATVYCMVYISHSILYDIYISYSVYCMVYILTWLPVFVSILAMYMQTGPVIHSPASMHKTYITPAQYIGVIL